MNNYLINILKENSIIIPTFKELINPATIPELIKKELDSIDCHSLNPRNLFRISWKKIDSNEHTSYAVHTLEIPANFLGIKSKVIGLVGQHFPTGSHKVGPAFSCLIEHLLNESFNPQIQETVWPSTGNYCRGGCYISNLFHLNPIAILPEEMSQERYALLKSLTDKIIITKGSESNVKEIFDKCRELKEKRGNVFIFNQFEEWGNYIWHYWLTGNAIKEVVEKEQKNKKNFYGMVLGIGSAGTISSGDFLKKHFPSMKIASVEALQCPTLSFNGFGEHGIEGISDKHVPWIYNIKNTDLVICIDDKKCLALLRLFNHPVGKDFLRTLNLGNEFLQSLSQLGISGIANLLACIKYAKYFELNDNDIIITMFTDSANLYLSKLGQLDEEYGAYSKRQAEIDYHCFLLGTDGDYIKELTYYDKKRIHNLKYFTWVEQYGKKVEEVNQQWYDYPDYWDEKINHIDKLDLKIRKLNEMAGVKA